MDKYNKEYFKSNLDAYLREEIQRKGESASFLLDWIQGFIAAAKDGKKIRILEIGGANGIFLKKILDLGFENLEVNNLEVVGEYKEHSADERINFFNQSLFGNNLENDSFDLILCRYALHHFIGNSYSSSSQLQLQALIEISGLLKQDGILAIQEEFMKKRFVSQVIFYLSKICSFLKFGWEARGIHPGVIISFLTRKGFFELLEKSRLKYKLVKEFSEFSKWSLFFRLMFLFQRPSFDTVILKVNK